MQEICRDVKSLDYAKRHLTASILALRNLHMLVSAVDQLALMVDDKQWRDAASLLCAIKDLLSLFAKYEDVPKIKALNGRVNIIKQKIKTEVFSEFQSLVPSSPLLADPDTQKMLLHACLAVDVLDPEVKEEMLSWFTKTQLQSYIAVFAPRQEGGSLGQTERRYTWLRRELKAYEENYSNIFPDKWEVPAVLSRDFCVLSNKHLSQILKEGGEKNDITVIIKVLQRTLEFEKELNLRFKRTNLDSYMSGNRHDSDDDEVHHQGVAEAIRRKYEEKNDGSGSPDKHEVSWPCRVFLAFDVFI